MPKLAENYEKLPREIRRRIVRMVFRSQTSHIGSALSVVDILTVLYFKILSIDPKNPQAEDRDRFILSKGHSCAALYATLALRGFFSEEILESYCQDDGRLPGHATMHCVPGVEVSTGSLGHGLAIGSGMAIAAKRANQKYRVFALLSDGECDEGSVWEAAMFAGHHKLDNLTAVIDRNRIQAFGSTDQVLDLEPLADKWTAFGWAVRKIDGHDYVQIEETLADVPFEPKKPSAIIAQTIKGKGVSFMENKLAWHYKSPNAEQLAQALAELGDIE